MACNSNAELIMPNPYQDGYSLSASDNSFTSNWADKRSTCNCSISVAFIGPTAPDGYCHLESSNAPENRKSTYGSGPLGSPIPWDTTTVEPSLQQVPVVADVSGAYVVRWELTFLSARWVRVKYVPTANVAGLQVVCWYNSPFLSA